MCKSYTGSEYVWQFLNMLQLSRICLQNVRIYRDKQCSKYGTALNWPDVVDRLRLQAKRGVFIWTECFEKILTLNIFKKSIRSKYGRVL